MKKLIENNLFGDGLVRIDQSILVDRYNNCLDDIGISKTNLSSFHIDKWGWSPEIANEKQNQDYLSFGFANPFGIIITPDQKTASIYHPFHSFDWDLMDSIFSTYGAQIADITTQFGLWFELDQELSTYRSPQDLLLLNTIEIKFYTPTNIIPHVRNQKKLIREFYDTPNGWANHELLDQLIDSATNHGDLRNRNFDIPPLNYSKLENFYTRAFGGLYVLNLAENKKLLIREDNNSTLSGELTHNHIEFNINDPQLFEFLHKQNIIKNDLNFFKTDIFSVINLKDQLLLDLVIKHLPEEEIDLRSDRKKNKYIHLLTSENNVDDDFYALEEIAVRLRRNDNLKIENYSSNIQRALSYPNPKFGRQEKIVLWSLISKMSPLQDALLMYLFDKNSFFASYQTWEEAKKDWVIDLIKEHKKHMFRYKINKN